MIINKKINTVTPTSILTDTPIIYPYTSINGVISYLGSQSSSYLYDNAASYIWAGYVDKDKLLESGYWFGLRFSTPRRVDGVEILPYNDVSYVITSLYIDGSDSPTFSTYERCILINTYSNGSKIGSPGLAGYGTWKHYRMTNQFSKKYTCYRCCPVTCTTYTSECEVSFFNIANL